MIKETRQQHSPQSLPLSPLWSVREEAFQTALSALTERDTSHSGFTAYMENSGAGMEEEEHKPYQVVNGVALVPLTGVLTRDPGWWSWLFGGTSMVHQRLCLMMASEDPEVESILLYVYSPGGEVYGVGDFVGSVIEAKKKKKVWAYIADEGCSAAYWAVCQAQKIICNSTAIVGSIGIMQVVEDWSAAYRKQGVKVRVFKSGEQKGAGVPGTSMTEEQEAETQRLVDAMAAQFFEAVETGRGGKITDAQMEEIATGALWLGAEALDMGLVDEIGTLEAALERLAPKEPKEQNAMRRYGAQNTTPPAPLSGNKEKPMFREFLAKLAASFARLGRNQMAAAALGADENNPDDLVTRLNAQIEAEVNSAVNANPLLAALQSAAIQTPEALQAALREAADGRAYAEDANQKLRAAAIRRFKEANVDQAAVDSYVAAYAHVPVSERLKVAAQWEADADKLFGTTRTEPAKRQTVPTALTTVATDAVDPTESPLSAEEKARIRKTAEAVAAGGHARNGQG